MYECKILADMPRRVTKTPKGINASIILINISIRQILIFQKDKRSFSGHPHVALVYTVSALSYMVQGLENRKRNNDSNESN